MNLGNASGGNAFGQRVRHRRRSLDLTQEDSPATSVAPSLRCAKLKRTMIAPPPNCRTSRHGTVARLEHPHPRPFLGPTPLDLIRQHLFTPLPPLATNHEGLPAALNNVSSG